jgi:hypothetical protein
MTTKCSAEEATLRADVAALLASANVASMRRFKASVIARRDAPPRVSTCKPRDEPLKDWAPRHVDATKRALQLVCDGVGIKTAPFAVGPDGWMHKFFTNEVAERILNFDDNNVTARPQRARFSLVVATLTARLVEHALALQTTEPDRFGDARLRMQRSHEHAGWSKTTTRGSGVVMNELGLVLFHEAAAKLVIA